MQERRDMTPSPTRAPPSMDDIRTQLARILGSEEFPQVGRSVSFLVYVVEEALAGRGDRIKGYSIAIEVFKRPEGFTQDDPVVRIEAGRLRRALERYYLVAGQDDPVTIEVAKGGYAPSFTWKASANSEISNEKPSVDESRWRLFPPSRNIVRVVIGAVLAIGVVTTGLMWFAHVGVPPKDSHVLDGPTLVIAPFVSFGNDHQAALYATGLTEELLTALPRFKEIKVFGRETSKSLSPETEVARVRDELGARFLLKGAVRVAGNAVRVTARLLDTDTNEILWSQTYDDEIHTRDMFAIQSDVANKVATAVAQPYGVITQAIGAKPPPNDLGSYGCTLPFYAYRAELSAVRHAEVRECLERAVDRFPAFATAWAMLSIIHLDEDRFKFNPRNDGSSPIDRSLRAARRAVQLDPGNARAQQALMIALFFTQNVPEALRVGEQALLTTPNDTELLGEFGTRVAMSGAWQRGATLLDQAIALNPGGGGYYHGIRGLVAYMLHDDKTAVIEIRQADLQKFPLFHAVAAVIYVDAGMMEDARREAARFNEMRPDFVRNIVAELKSRNIPPGDRARMIADIRKAGLPAEDEVRSTMLAPTDGSVAVRPR